ncbi:hypothetical protein BH18ACT14_BH18ACT14_10190 [soil metagenome]
MGSGVRADAGERQEPGFDLVVGKLFLGCMSELF